MPSNTQLVFTLAVVASAGGFAYLNNPALPYQPTIRLVTITAWTMVVTIVLLLVYDRLEKRVKARGSELE